MEPNPKSFLHDSAARELGPPHPPDVSSKRRSRTRRSSAPVPVAFIRDAPRPRPVPAPPPREALKDARRIVIKIGTNTLSRPDGHPDLWFLAAVADDVVELRAQGREVLIVSSGAIGSGRAALGLKEKPREIRQRQACAAVGQPRLMAAWDQAFSRHGVRVAQLLLTYHTFSSRHSYLNLRNATEALLGAGVVPVVNENDTVSIDEIDASFGDNDRLSALVAGKVAADALLVLSDVAGLYTRPPNLPGAELVPEVVGEITPEIRRMAAAKPGSSKGRGGMISKLDSAQVAMDAGVTVVIASGRIPRVIPRVFAGEEIGTRFVPIGREQGRKRWLAIAKPRGSIDVDAGAADALRAGKHLLPAGVVGVEGVFDVESVVDVRHDKRAIARAVSAYSSRDLERVMGMRSDDARAALALGPGPVNVTTKGSVVLLP